MKLKLNKTISIVFFIITILVFSSVALATPDKPFNNDLAQQVISQKSFQHKRIILDSISETDINQLEMNGCSVKHKMKKGTSFECPENIDLQGINAREARIFHIVELDAAQMIGADDVWSEGIEGSGVNVVILDTGIDSSHPELSDSYLGGYDFVNSDSTPEDGHGHGTHVAGIITANGNDPNAKGIAPGAGFYMLKVCTADGLCTEDDMLAGMEYAMDNIFDAKIMSISIGGGNYGGPNCDYDSLAAKVNDVVDNGFSVVVSSGNDGSYVSSPACASKAIAVAAVHDDGSVVYWSNYGPSLDISAPGYAIYSTLPGSYASWSGTSMAAPQVSGVIALLLEENPGLSDAEIKTALYSTATPASGCNRCRFVWYGRCIGYRQVACTSDDEGAGIVNAYQAYLSIKQTVQDSDGDGVPDDQDVCPGFDDNVDSDGDGVPDGCDGCTDVDQDTYCAETNDCDDSDASVNPAAVEACNNIDNDCDGSIDEGLILQCGSDVGECSFGTQTCAAGVWGVCVGGTDPVPEVCDGLDNDCDGHTDEGSLCFASNPYAEGMCLAASCSFYCSSGYHSCGTSGQSITCYADDDVQYCGDDSTCTSCVASDPNAVSACIGQACSYDCAPGYHYCGSSGPSMSCYLDDDTQHCGPSCDVCASGDSCVNDVCTSGCVPEPEVCNNIDDDCDGSIDEGLTQQCGSDVGECSFGTQTCAAGVWGACVGGIDPVPEVCDGLDNNCDGTTDEGLIQPTTCGVGACSGNTGEVTCSAGAWVGDTCDPFLGAVHEVSNGLDDDCDGGIDEGDVCNSGAICWDGNNEYLKRNLNQLKKFCKCAEGNYAFAGMSYVRESTTAYQYVDYGDNTNWETTAISNFFPIYRVKCADGNWYYTNQNHGRLEL
ncbi:MAG: S8 family serine peptidase [bacterium]|nr:S8 family serine peptidase [bacterium]